jgi:3-deoxy-manno-octulosonate cytidylyltransferase (CMP-KDO synthetase)
MAFRRDFLIHFTKLQPTPLEIIESIDMLRAIEYGYQIRMVETASEVVGVDTPEDLERVKILMKRDSLFSAYSKKT